MKTQFIYNQHFISPLEKTLPWLRLIILSTALVLVLRAGFAHAETAGDSANTPASSTGASAKSLEQSADIKVRRDARGRKIQYVDFSDVMIEGRARTPDGFVIQSRSPGRFKSLIELRSNFRDNIRIHAHEASSAIGLAD